MKIIYHHRTQMDDAQGIHIIKMVNAFRAGGHQVKLMGLVEKDQQSKKKTKGKHWEILTGMLPHFFYEIMAVGYNLFGYFKLKSLIKDIQPDLIYERYAMHNFCGVLAAKRNHIPIILEVNAPLYYEQKKYGKIFFKKLAKYIENWVCNNATQTIVVTSVLKKILTEQGVNPANLVVMYNGIDREEFKSNIDGEQIRRQYQIKKGETVIGLVGWFREWHGLDFLIKTCLGKNLFLSKNIRLLLVGDGPVISDIKSLISEHNIRQYVHITGAINRSEIPKYIAAFDIALQPRATSYACPMKIIEFLALGRAIIAPDQPNIRELLTDNDTGLLFEPENMEDLFSKIEMLVNDRHLLNKLMSNAKDTVEQRNLFWSENARRIELMIEEL